MSAKRVQSSVEYNPSKGLKRDNPRETSKRGKSIRTNAKQERLFRRSQQRGVSERDKENEDMVWVEAKAEREGPTSGLPSGNKSVDIDANGLPSAYGIVILTSHHL